MILLFEPQCRGFAHEQVNAAFVYAFSLANPGDKVEFWADASHIECIKKVFELRQIICRVVYKSCEIPDSHKLDSFSSFLLYLRVINRMLSFAKSRRPVSIVLLSVHPYNLFAIKMLMKLRRYRSFCVQVVVHAILETYLEVFKGRSWGISKLKDFGSSLRFALEKPVHYWVLSRKIFENFCSKNAMLSSKFSWIDHPYIFCEDRTFIKPSSPRKIFATVGKGNPVVLKEIATELLKRAVIEDLYELRVIGDNTEILSGQSNVNCISPLRRVSRAELESKIKDVDFVLMLYGPDSYSLTASGAFFDAMAYFKPLIFLENGYISSYFSRFKFGYQCDTIESVVGKIEYVLNNSTRTAYSQEYNKFIQEIERFREECGLQSSLQKLSVSR